MRLATAETVTAADLPGTLAEAVVHADEEPFRKAAIALARRFPRDPASREFLLAMADRAATDADRAKAAETFAAELPGDKAYLLAWAERAGWAGDIDGETRARERIAALDGDDLDNRRVLADLYAARNRPDGALEQWRHIAAREGLGSKSTLRLIDALLATGEIDEAMAILERRARLPSASIEDQLEVGEQVFGKGQLDRAIRFFEAVLEKRPDHPHALLRLGPDPRVDRRSARRDPVPREAPRRIARGAGGDAVHARRVSRRRRGGA